MTNLGAGLRGLAGLALLGALAGCSPAADEPAAPKAEAAAKVEAAVAAPPAPPSKYVEVESPGAARDAVTPYRSDTVDVIVAEAGAAGGGDKLEYKIAMKAGDTLTYAWDAPGATDLWHEFHGHTEDRVSFYKKALGAKHQGVLVAPFDGIQGWYFENRSAKPVVVRIRMGGFYELMAD
ncbi:MAG: hypothetical protein U1C74_07515 [Phenylobacterium sp.]|nr:hypothetical protein [Phenylobacterium sp.]